MPKYLLRRFAEMLITLFLIATATFFLLEAVPGDPLTERASKLSPTVKENLYKRYGLDKPMMERYVITMKGICKGEFGESVVYAGQTVQKLIHDRLPVSARLGIQQVLVGITIGLLLYALIAVFQLVTLPVEFNASHRALKVINETGVLDDEERAGARKVLSAAAMTYVASLLVSLANLLRFVIRFSGRNRRN